MGLFKYGSMNNQTKMYSMKCPACGAHLDFSDDIEVMYCKYCGEKIFLDNVERLIGKVVIKKSNDKYEYKKLKLEKKEEEQKRAIKLLLILFPVCFAIPGGILGGFAISDHAKVKELKLIEQQIEEYYVSGNYDAALFKANQLVYDGSWSDPEPWDKKREAWIELIEKSKEEK